jgi:hypothetical protein
MSYKSAVQGGSLSAGMSDRGTPDFPSKVAHFAPEWVAHFAPGKVAQFRPEWVAQFGPE